MMSHKKNKAIRKFVFTVLVFVVIIAGGILGYQHFKTLESEQEIESPEKAEGENIAEQAQQGEIVFDVLYVTWTETLFDDELKWLDIFAIPKIIDYRNEKSAQDFADYLLKGFPFQNITDGSLQYSLIKENVSAEEAKSAMDSFINSMFENNQVDRYSECSPYLHFLKKQVVSVALRCYSSGGAHPIFYLIARNYDLENNKAIKLEDFIIIGTEELKSFIREKKEGAVLCDEDMFQNDITNFYFTDGKLTITLAGHRLNPDCPPDSEFSFSIDEIKEIIKPDSVVSRLME